ncbi:imidazole glycerol phosphate synthase subunit HisH [Aestuariispira insulae]|uniref:Imidazole glycerol phosphate synthase subunit HisH n=1 Tax=Aestuariispira insulae TaxID=1461337 RepID=A0A3D9HX67_9PROT|nr:imidazole glycerol phosphate synthase subunit HisH [Aestuariispira insulae]RED54098.1 glutamine amidotransferase [Aestuariispira insulae]
MNRRVTIVDYGSGNLLSVRRALECCAGEVTLAQTPEQVRHADRLVLPGVGAFAHCMALLRGLDLLDPLKEVAARGNPFLGICVGMQILMTEGHEFGKHAGLGLIDGMVEPIPTLDGDGGRLKVPHIGWNALGEPIAGRWDKTLLDGGLRGGSQVYFVHSYAARPANSDDRLAETRYGGQAICAAVAKDNVVGTQFHPEKSAEAGLDLLERFLGW